MISLNCTAVWPENAAPFGVRLTTRRVRPGRQIDEWGGKEYRVFFFRKAENWRCYCFSQSVADPFV
jgi:hypothetical protein